MDGLGVPIRYIQGTRIYVLQAFPMHGNVPSLITFYQRLFLPFLNAGSIPLCESDISAAGARHCTA